MTRLASCPVCSGRRLAPLLCRPNVVVHQNLVMGSAAAARAVARGELDIVACEQCSFVFNRAYDPALLSYGSDYDNTQCHSALFDAYLDDRVRALVAHAGAGNCRVVEVGCGKGHFLRKLVDVAGSRISAAGFDPSYEGADTQLDGRLVFHRRNYDESCVAHAADIVVCRHVIEHIPDPLAMLKSIRATLAGSPAARVCFETPCVDWILRGNVIWDFFYEHCSLFSGASLRRAFQEGGFAVRRVDNVFAGQYLWLEAAIDDAEPAPDPVDSAMTLRLAQAYRAAERTTLADWESRLAALATNGKIALWGAGAKGATLANLVDPQCRWIEALVDVNPAKQGRYVPGTGHPIIAPRELRERHIRCAVLMNPNYRPEVEAWRLESGIPFELIDWRSS